MRKFLFGLIVGLAVGVGAAAYAGAGCGGTGYIYGWTVEVNGREICYDPYLESYTKTIECE